MHIFQPDRKIDFDPIKIIMNFTTGFIIISIKKERMKYSGLFFVVLLTTGFLFTAVTMIHQIKKQ